MKQCLLHHSNKHSFLFSRGNVNHNITIFYPIQTTINYQLFRKFKFIVLAIQLHV